MKRLVRQRPSELLFGLCRALCWAGLGLMLVINFYRGGAHRAAYAGLFAILVRGSSRQPVRQHRGEMVVDPAGERLVAIDGRPLPIDAARRTAAMEGPDGAWVTITLRRQDGSLHRTRVVRSPVYERQAFAGSGLNLTTRQTASFLLDLVSRLVGLVAAFVLFLKRPRDPVAMLFFVAMLLNGFPVATSGTMWPGLGGVLLVAVAQFSLVLTGLLFPHGWMRAPWHWLALCIAIFTLWRDVAGNMGWWFPVALTGPRWMAITAASLTSLLAAIVAQYRLTSPGVERQQFKPVAFGSGVWIVLFVIGDVFAFIIAPQFTGEGASAWLKMIEWACYSIAWMGLPVGLLVALSRYRLYDADSAISRSLAYLLITIIIVAVFGAVDDALTAFGNAEESSP